ncbi:HET-domain-containing protein [Cadophora sp. DSE1049]|nr:HET-domain-containing protein [Cadophora sp. DSE1049]
MTETTLFPYEPVKTGEFRVLLLNLSHDPTLDIKCSLVRETLPPVQPYDALSYTWGTDPPKKFILFDGTEFPVRENLYQALLRLRLPDIDRRIWVDAICINQLDIEERNCQVAQMRTVYSNANEVAVWLGEHTDESRRAIQFIPRVFQSVSEPGWLDRGVGFWQAMKDPDFLVGLSHLSSFLTLPWWRRTWIIQEVALAKNPPNIYHGQDHLSWPVLERLLDCISPLDFHQMRYQGDENPGGRLACITLTFFQRAVESNAMTLTYLHLGKKTGYSCSLLEALERSEHFLATDPRDKVFGLLGLLDPPSPLKVTYSLSYSIVNTTCISQVIQESRNLKCLGWVTGHDSRDDLMKRTMPSWVRDLTLNVRDLVLARIAYKLQREELRPFYQAGGHEQLTMGSTLQFSDNNKILILRGILLDVISAIGAPAPSREEIFQQKNSLGSVISEWKVLAGHHTPEDFWRTVVMDIDKERGGIFSRRFMTTSEGRIGIAPTVAKVGDRICIFTGGRLPCIVRPGKNGCWEFVGESFVLGLVDGEAIVEERIGKRQYREFRLA